MIGVHEFSEPSELGALSTLPLRARGRGRVRLRGRLALHEKSTQWERDLNRYYFACGCEAGAKGLLIGVAGAAFLIAGSAVRGWLDWKSLILITLALLIVAATIGKIVGLFQADRRLKQLVRQIREEVPPEHAAAQGRLCG